MFNVSGCYCYCWVALFALFLQLNLRLFFSFFLFGFFHIRFTFLFFIYSFFGVRYQLPVSQSTMKHGTKTSFLFSLLSCCCCFLFIFLKLKESHEIVHIWIWARTKNCEGEKDSDIEWNNLLNCEWSLQEPPLYFTILPYSLMIFPYATTTTKTTNAKEKS